MMFNSLHASEVDEEEKMDRVGGLDELGESGVENRAGSAMSQRRNAAVEKNAVMRLGQKSGSLYLPH